MLILVLNNNHSTFLHCDSKPAQHSVSEIAEPRWQPLSHYLVIYFTDEGRKQRCLKQQPHLNK